jgi:hypothetical protein
MYFETYIIIKHLDQLCVHAICRGTYSSNLDIFSNPFLIFFTGLDKENKASGTSASESSDHHYQNSQLSPPGQESRY